MTVFSARFSARRWRSNEPTTSQLARFMEKASTRSKVAYGRCAARFAEEATGLRRQTSSSEAIRTGRWMARREQPFAVFLFGMRLNRLRGLRRWLWGRRVLRAVLADLAAHPERGLLG